MKFLKFLAIIIGVFFLVNVLVKMLQKAVKTSIQFEGLDNAKQQIKIGVYSNGEKTQAFTVPFSLAAKETYTVNDYTLQVDQLATLIVFRVKDDKENEIAVKPMDKNNAPQQFTIFSE